MDLLVFLIGILSIVGAVTFCIHHAVERHHEREMRAHELAASEQNQRYILTSTMLDELIKQKALPPGIIDRLMNR